MCSLTPRSKRAKHCSQMKDFESPPAGHYQECKIKALHISFALQTLKIHLVNTIYVSYHFVTIADNRRKNFRQINFLKSHFEAILTILAKKLEANSVQLP